MHWWEAASTKEKLCGVRLGVGLIWRLLWVQVGSGKGARGWQSPTQECPLEQLIFQDMECGPKSPGLALGISERQRITSQSGELWRI